MPAPAGAQTPGPSADDRLEMFRVMSTIKAADERILRGLNSGELRFMYYPVAGQEAIPAAVCRHLRPDDYLVTTYRCLHDCIAKGVSLREIFAEMCGRATGTSGGKGGPMHLADPRVGLMATTGIVGGGMPIGVGLALAAELRGTDQIAVTSFGDGATSIGGAHEALNMAALWDLPVVFVCQHNQWGEHTRFGDYTRTRRLADRAEVLGMEAVTIDGNDPVEVWYATRIAAERARRGDGPTFLECLTYRLGGHNFGSTTAYMDAEELARARAVAPVGRYRERLIREHAVDEARLGEIEATAETVVEDALAFALASRPPGPDDLHRDVYAPAEPTR